MKLIKTILKTAAIALTLTSANAMADCHINVELCKPAGISTPTSFKDWDLTSQVNTQRCLQRAREYYAWCNSPQQTVSSVYIVKGVPTVGNYVNTNGSGLFTFDIFRRIIYLGASY